MKKTVIAFIGAAALLPAVALAQGQAAPVTPQLKSPTIVSGRLATTVETKTTAGQPYSAEAVSESIQVLADGNRISNRTVTRIYRDSQGRTRREMLTAEGTVRTVSVSDPVAKTSFTLEPETRTAYTAGAMAMMQPTTRVVEGVMGRGDAVTGGGGGGARGGSAETRVVGGFGGGSAATAAPMARSGGGGGRGGGVGTLARTAVDDPNTRREELGQQTIEGVTATGTRTTTVIPAGAIGNVQEIRVVSEQWVSTDLGVLVLTKRSDPRTGENTYKLTNIVRAEPDPALFIVPADYTIKQRGVRDQ